VQSIVTSTAQNDSGLFELNFHDERYLPFEYAGAISLWQLDMKPNRNVFDFETITDIIMKLNYTAREGGVEFATTCEEESKPPSTGLVRLFSAKHDYSNDWYRFVHPADVNATTFTLSISLGPARFPYLYRNCITGIDGLTVAVRPAEGQDTSSFVGQTFLLTAADGSNATLTLSGPDDNYALPYAETPKTFRSPTAFGTWSLTTQKDQIDPTTIEDLFILFRYTAS
jgi:hypothetical protein